MSYTKSWRSIGRDEAKFDGAHRSPGLERRVAHRFHRLFAIGPDVDRAGDDYRLKSHVAQVVDPSLPIRFMSFYRPQHTVASAIELPVG